ncbi:hypothetical protein KFE25_010242 [Diacronema lutheri]|uniref:Uncharacterized protein n=1 Tax=Diacronema lutheri TaxID=2081491 RepID=A0A8J6C9T2_DIALT|nr:hypothetical protein KFE25_010242 [Diacronema lutheri]
MAPTARGAYRALLRAQRALFAGDTRALAAAHEQTRAEFHKWREVADPSLAASLVADALDTATFMRQSVVQTVRNERGNFELKPDPQLHFSTSKVPEYVEDIGEAARLAEIKERRRGAGKE